VPPLPSPVAGLAAPAKSPRGPRRVPPAPRPVSPQVELKTGEMLRGELHAAEDNWNCQVKNAIHTGKDGRTTHMDHIYLRGSRIRFFVVPDMLKNAPMFKRIDPKLKGKLGPMGLGTVSGRGGGGGRGGGRGGRGGRF